MPSAGLALVLTMTLLLGPIHVRAGRSSRPNGREVVRKDMSASGLASASWIWTTNSNGTSGAVAFLKSFNTPSGKTASSAVISMAAVDHFTLYVNGQPIGASGTAPDEWKSAHVLRAALNASENMFSVLVLNSGRSASPPPGLLAAIQISYSDSTNSTVVSDSSWLASSDIPSDFPSPSNLSPFSSAVIAASYGSGPWGQNVALPVTDPSPLTLQGSTWIWSSTNAYQGAPVGSVGFRSTFSTPSGKIAKSATVLLTVDNTFAFYLNGDYIGSPPVDLNIATVPSVWPHPQQFIVNLNSTLNVFNIIAQNFPAQGTTDPTAAGLIGAIQIFYTDGTSEIIRTDTSWLNGAPTSVPTFLSANDSLLSPSISQGPLGMEPWGQLQSTSDALNAASVPTAPFNASTPPPPTATALTSSNSHPIPIAAIVAPIVGVLAIVAMITAFLVWKSSRSAKRTRTGLSVVTPFSRYTAIPSDTSSSERPSTLGYPEAPPPGYSYNDSEQSVAAESEPLVPERKRRW
ncbi:hypothetical protein B0H13DRAFT_2075864 [Mycena leptocephala]|nr:hypothetical protein B0H13DRAFT_2075864 [Mycena leptocephala]